MPRSSDYVDLAAIRAEAKRLGQPAKILDGLPREHAVIRNRRVWGRVSVFGWLAGEAAAAGRRSG